MYDTIHAFAARLDSGQPVTSVGARFDEVVLGDINGDGAYSALDLSLFKQAFDSVLGDESYNPRADFNSDGRIDDADLDIFRAALNQQVGHLVWTPTAAHRGQTYTFVVSATDGHADPVELRFELTVN